MNEEADRHNILLSTKEGTSNEVNPTGACSAATGLVGEIAPRERASFASDIWGTHAVPRGRLNP